MARPTCIFGSGGPMGLLLAVIFSCRRDWQRGRSRRQVETLIFMPAFRGLLRGAGVEPEPAEWRRFLTVERIEDAVPGFTTAAKARQLLGVVDTRKVRGVTTINLGGVSVVTLEGVERAVRKKEAREK